MNRLTVRSRSTTCRRRGAGGGPAGGSRAAGRRASRRPAFDATIASSTVRGMRVVFVHGACVKDGAWWWHPTAALLAERGVASVTPALPSCGEANGALGGLSEDVAAVRAALT